MLWRTEWVTWLLGSSASWSVQQELYFPSQPCGDNLKSKAVLTKTLKFFMHVRCYFRTFCFWNTSKLGEAINLEWKQHWAISQSFGFNSSCAMMGKWPHHRHALVLSVKQKVSIISLNNSKIISFYSAYFFDKMGLCSTSCNSLVFLTYKERPFLWGIYWIARIFYNACFLLLKRRPDLYRPSSTRGWDAKEIEYDSVLWELIPQDCSWIMGAERWATCPV